MLTGEWIKRGPCNSLSVTIGGIVRPLRYTVWQQECYQELLAKRRDQARAEAAKNPPAQPDPGAGFAALAENLGEARLGAVEVAMIALNPEKDKVSIDEATLLKELDLDQIAILVDRWLHLKVYSPRLTPETDPHLAPR